jgi:hypothetical protein
VVGVSLRCTTSNAANSYHQPATRSERGATDDRSPNCAQQRDNYSCGVFTMTDAFCLAFGFDLLRYREKNLDFGKRPRIAAELNNEGFSREFGYDMFDLPIGPTDRLGTQQPSVLMTAMDLKTYLASFERESSDEEAFVFGLQPSIKTKAPRPRKAGDFDKTPILNAITALTYEKQLKAESRPQPITASPYPSQFDKVFQQAGFLYATPVSINFNTSIDYYLEELKDACRRFPLEGWEDWYVEPKDVFTKWMLNEMGSFMSLARHDPLKPVKGIARGFEKWKAEQDAKSPRKQPPTNSKK